MSFFHMTGEMRLYEAMYDAFAVSQQISFQCHFIDLLINDALRDIFQNYEMAMKMPARLSSDLRVNTIIINLHTA